MHFFSMFMNDGSLLDSIDVMINTRETDDPAELSTFLGLNIFHLNIRSARKNFNNLCILLQSFPVKMDLIILTEAWIDENNDFKFTLPGYDVFYSYNRFNKCDGLLSFCASELNPRFRSLNISESNACQIIFSFNNNEFCALACYRPPSANVDLFVSSLHDHLRVLDMTHANVIIAGDLNIDISSIFSQTVSDVSPSTTEYLDTLAAFGFESAINVFTRVSNTSHTCIDHIFFKSNFPVSSMVYQTSITDHYAVILNLKTGNVDPVEPDTDSYMRTDAVKLNESLSNETWQIVQQAHCPDIAATAFLSIFAQHVAQASSIHPKSNRKNNIKPWITRTMLKEMRIRDKLNLRAKRDPSNQMLRSQYKQFRNKINKIIKLSRNLYFKEKLYGCRGDLGKTWAFINEITDTKKKSNNISRIVTESGQLTEGKAIADYFNNYYTTVAQNLCNNISPSRPPCPKVFNTDYNELSLFLFPADVDETKRHIRSLNNSFSKCNNGLSTFIYKLSIDAIATPITHIINLCFSTGIFPDACKHAIITNILKDGDREKPDNWRPISKVITLAKIIEKAIKNRIMQFFDLTNFLSSSQFGFRPNLNTQGAILHLCNNVYRSLNVSKPCIAVFLDIKKAFDTVNHALLLEKLLKSGIRGIALALLQSYLSNRTQQVSITAGDGSKYLSSSASITSGVPQGTVLGPLLFSVYVNELCGAKIANCIITCFADDTAIYFEGESWPEVFQSAQQGINEISNWYKFNKLTLNALKCSVMQFYNGTTRSSQQPLSIHAHPSSHFHHCDNNCNFSNCTCSHLLNVTNSSCTSDCVILSSTNTVKYLGVMIDENMKWKSHIQLTTRRIRKTMYKFHLLRCILDQRYLRTVYFAIVQSISTYAITAWGGTYKTILKPLNCSINMVIKIILFHPRRYPTDLIFTELNVLPLIKLYFYNLVLYSVSLPHSDDNREHSMTTRSIVSNNMSALRATRNIFEHSPNFLAIRAFNTLPREVKILVGMTGFKNALRGWIENADLAVFTNLL